MNTSLLETSITEFTAQLASKTSVPGGGGASALAASIGIALGDMVGEFTLGKKKYAQTEPEMIDIMAQAQALRRDFLQLIEADAIAFEPLSKAYGIPKDDPNRAEVLEKCLDDAAQVPLSLLRLCEQALTLLKRFGEIGSVLMISDAATGAAIVGGAACGAAVNVKINTSSMKNREKADSMNAETDTLLSSCNALSEEIFTGIYSRY